ncbi:MAG: Xaa-Pro peptidase family protein [Pseudomonadota bacterium]
MPNPPTRGFPESEFVRRCEGAQRAMATAGLDVLLLTCEPEVRYFSGFLSRFWESPTRPWFLLVPVRGKPIAVIPEIGAAGMAATWIEDIRTWSAPDLKDDGISLLKGALDDVTEAQGRIGLAMDLESHLRMPLRDFEALRARLPGKAFVDAGPLLRSLRGVKSEAEIDKIRYACHVASSGFEALPGHAALGQSEREICRQLKINMLSGGADSTPYVIAGSGPGGYDNIIMGPTDRQLGAGDVLIIDTGTTYDGYFCDFDRNWAFGRSDDEVRRAYEVVFAATEAGYQAARPGATAADLWAAMARVMEAGGSLGNEVGRLGHGLGMQLTEGHSNMPGDETILQPGMVVTLEPGMTFAPQRMMVHEENIVIREGEAEWLSWRAAPELPIIK